MSWRAEVLRVLYLLPLVCFLLTACGDSEVDLDEKATGFSDACRGQAKYSKLTDKNWLLNRKTDSIELNFNPAAPFMNVIYTCINDDTTFGSLGSIDETKSAGIKVQNENIELLGPITFTLNIPNANKICNLEFKGSYAHAFKGSCLRLSNTDEVIFYQAK